MNRWDRLIAGGKVRKPMRIKRWRDRDKLRTGVVDAGLRKGEEMKRMSQRKTDQKSRAGKGMQTISEITD